ncbi:MAG TPA: response regulator [Longimicrobiales bacterium]|nr:response regulator [Longimicrobiales bacterium]
MDTPSDLTPLVLLVDDQEWTSRSIESILRPKGHVVLKAYTGQQALDLVRKVDPDALIVDVHLPDIDGIDLVRQLRASPTIHATTPVLMITGGAVGRAERLEALGAGAWDILTHPVEPSELILRMETFIRAKQDADRLREEGLTDPNTGFYNARGLLKRAREIGADALRFERPLTCIAFGPHSFTAGLTASDELADLLTRGVADALRSVTRVSDTIGRLGPGEFVVVAPGTDESGARRLADRVFEAIEAIATHTDLIDPEELRNVRAGFCAIRGDEPATPEDLLLKATMALRRAQSENGSFRVRAYDA